MHLDVVSENGARAGELPVLVVVGNGMVGHHFCDKLAELQVTSRFKVMVFGEEPRVAYDRVHLTDYFSTRKPESLSLSDRASRDARIELSPLSGRHDRATSACSRPARVGDRVPHVVLATARLVVRRPGVESKGVFVTPIRTSRRSPPTGPHKRSPSSAAACRLGRARDEYLVCIATDRARASPDCPTSSTRPASKLPSAE